YHHHHHRGWHYPYFGFYYAWRPYGYGCYPYWNVYPGWGMNFGFGVSYYGPAYRTVFVESEPYYGPGEVVEEVIYDEAPQQAAEGAPLEQPLEQPAEEDFPVAPAQPAEPSTDGADTGDTQAAPRKPHADFEPSVKAFLAGDYQGALGHLDNVVRDEADNGEAWLAVMHANFALGRYGPASSALAKAGALGAFPRGYQFDPAPLYAKQAGAFDGYLQALDDHLAANPKDADAQLVRAYMHVTLGEKGEARTALDKVLELRPADETAPELALALLPPPPPPVKQGAVEAPAKK
ncbi:MAG: tetratricopeptide repeat protein, partial [Planctomycetota bacterium]|nr:tetratricopeptide repeat protein [Planctomycetota bacterium]